MNLSSVDVDTVQVQKMLFLYNAVLDGWTVRRVPSTGASQTSTTFEFTKDRRCVKKELLCDNFLEHFATQHLTMDSLLTSSKPIDSEY